MRLQETKQRKQQPNCLILVDVMKFCFDYCLCFDVLVINIYVVDMAAHTKCIDDVKMHYFSCGCQSKFFINLHLLSIFFLFFFFFLPSTVCFLLSLLFLYLFLLPFLALFFFHFLLFFFFFLILFFIVWDKRVHLVRNE